MLCLTALKTTCLTQFKLISGLADHKDVLQPCVELMAKGVLQHVGFLRVPAGFYKDRRLRNSKGLRETSFGITGSKVAIIGRLLSDVKHHAKSLGLKAFYRLQRSQGTQPLPSFGHKLCACYSSPRRCIDCSCIPSVFVLS